MGRQLALSVVFDARVDMIGEFLVAGARSRHTVIEKIVDRSIAREAELRVVPCLSDVMRPPAAQQPLRARARAAIAILLRQTALKASMGTDPIERKKRKPTTTYRLLNLWLWL